MKNVETMNMEIHFKMVKEFKTLNPNKEVLDKYKSNYTPAYVAFLYSRIQ